MKRLTMLALAGLMTVVLGACGESSPPKPDAGGSSDVAIEQNQDQQDNNNQQQDNNNQQQDNQDQQAAPSEDAPAATTEGGDVSAPAAQ